MKPNRMFTMASCPYCQKARRWMDELMAENPAYRALSIDIVDEVEQPEYAEQFDYYYVPTYYVDGKKVHEGAATKQIVRRVFDAALKD